MRRIALLILCVLCSFNLINLFAQTDPFEGDWYKIPEGPNGGSFKEIYRIKRLPSGEYYLRGKLVHADTGELESYFSDDYVFVPKESDNKCLVFYKDIYNSVLNGRQIIYYRFTPKGDLGILHIYKTFGVLRNNRYQKEWVNYPEDSNKWVLYRIDDF